MNLKHRRKKVKPIRKNNTEEIMMEFGFHLKEKEVLKDLFSVK